MPSPGKNDPFRVPVDPLEQREEVLRQLGLLPEQQTLRAFASATEASRLADLIGEAKQTALSDRRDADLLRPRVLSPLVPEIKPNPAYEAILRTERLHQEAKARDEEKVEYARRSALASEAALDAAKARAAEAEEEARQAKQEKLAAQRNMRLSLWFAGASLLLAAWQFIEKYL